MADASPNPSKVQIDIITHLLIFRYFSKYSISQVDFNAIIFDI